MSKKEKVLTFLKYSLRNRDIFVEQENNEMASGENPPYMLIDEKDIETLLAKISSSGSNNNSSIVATTQLPQFRGRRRKNDLAFVETKTFDNHYKSLIAYLGQFKNLTEQNKKEFLINSAHNSCGDFKETVVKLCENFPNSTYLEIVTKLKKIYVIEAAKSLQFAANKVLNTTLSDDKTLGSQIVDVGASIEAVTNFLFKNEDSLIDKFEHYYEGYDDDDDDDDERKKKVVRKYFRKLVHNAMFVCVYGPSFEAQVFNKLYDKEDLPTADELQNKILDVIQDNPFGKRILRNKKKTTNESFHVELGENSNDIFVDETENPCETTDVYVQGSQSSGSRGYRGQRSRRLRGGRLRNRGRGAGTQHDTGYVGDDYIGDSSFTAETQSYYQASHSSRGNYHNQKAEQKQCYHCGQFGHLKRECPSIFCELCGQRATVKLNAQQKGLSSPNEAKIFSNAATCIFKGKRQVRRTR